VWQVGEHGRPQPVAVRIGASDDNAAALLVRFPTLPNPKFAGQPGHGDFSDALAEMDSHVGKTFDAVDALGIHFSRPGHVGGQLHGSS
jgi:hypothetical protein